MLEAAYQNHVIRTLRKRFRYCIILKNDSGYLQGIPDLIVLWNDRWAMLEVKPSLDAPFRPNQEYYLHILDEMSFAAVIAPENEKEVLDDLQRAFEVDRPARLSQR